MFFMIVCYFMSSSPLVLFIVKIRLNLGGNAKNAKLVKKMWRWLVVCSKRQGVSCAVPLELKMVTRTMTKFFSLLKLLFSSTTQR